MAFDIREQSGIDTILRDEGIENDIRQLRALLSKGSVLNALSLELDYDNMGRRNIHPATPPPIDTTAYPIDDSDVRDREYPTAGADAYNLATEDIDPYQVAIAEAASTEVDDAPSASDDSSGRVSA